jgi:hypothetical protein
MKSRERLLLLVRELIRELQEDGIGREELERFLRDAVDLSFEDPAAAFERSARDLEEYDRLP